MSPFTIAALALSMSADAFAASISRGAATRPNLPRALAGALVFGTIETITPLVGFAIGLVATGFVAEVDHWVAFVILGGVGLRMIWEALHDDDGAAVVPGRKRGLLMLCATALGTSIDAAAVGVSLAFVGGNIWPIALSIGAATFTMTAIGLRIGGMLGSRFGKSVEIVGGNVLIAIGTAILLEHLGLLR
jgi:manganese efflux pump family protein